MCSWKVVSATVLLVACDPGPLAPRSRPPAIGGVGQPRVTTLAAPSLVVVAPGQVVVIARDGGQTDRAWFEARFTVGDGDRGESAPISDGAILVVSAADGPMPQSSPDAETLRIVVRSATLGPDGVRFTGVATLSDARGESEPFDVAGSVPSSGEGNPDYIVWDIVGGNVHEMSFPALTLMRIVGGDE